MKTKESRAVRSWPTQEQLLIWRIEDLEGRLEELRERLPDSCMDEGYDRAFCSQMANCEIDYAVPADLSTIEDVLTAIARTKDKLWCLACDERAAALAAEQASADMIPAQIVIIGFANPAAQEPQRLAS